MIASTSCVVCSRAGAHPLCSLTCLREAVHERERNVHRLRLLRRTGGAAASESLVRRNAELTAALLARRPAGGETVVGTTRLDRSTTGTWRRTDAVS